MLGDCIKLKKGFTLHREQTFQESSDHWSFKNAVWADAGIYTVIGMTKPNKRGMHAYYLWGAKHHGWTLQMLLT